MNKYIGSSLNNFLAKEDLLMESEIIAVKRLLAKQLEKAMKDKKLSKTCMANVMGTSRAALDRLLDPTNTSVTLHTLGRAAKVVGKHIHIALSNHVLHEYLQLNS